MSKDYQVRQYRPGDEDGILELLQLVFNGWPHYDIGCKPLDHWRWKYLDNPLRKNFITLGISDDRVIGVNHAIPTRIKMDGKTFLCAYAADTGVHPDFRRMGVLNKMRDLKRASVHEEDITLNYFVSSNPIIIEGHFRGGFPHFPHKISNLVRIKDVNIQVEAIPVRNAWLMKLGFRAAKLINDFKNAFEKREKSGLDVMIRDLPLFDGRIDEFWEEVSAHNKFIIERTMDYLNWRYCDARAGNFTVKEAEDENGRILGYSVLKINRYLKDYSIGYIVDLLTLPGHLNAVDALVAQSVQYFDEQNINMINYLIVKNHPNERILKRHGFLDSGINIQLLYRPFKTVEELDKIETFPRDCMHFSYGDIDSLPVEMPRYR